MTTTEKREKVILGLESCTNECCATGDICPYFEFDGCDCEVNLHKDAVALLKAQKTLEEVAEDYGLTPDGVEFALNQYQTVICEITHSRMSKLSYYAGDILSIANDLKCDGCELIEAQGPRVMTLDELFDSDTAFIELHTPGEPVHNCVIHYNVGADGIGIKPIHGNVSGAYLRCGEYGKSWRPWTSRPTDAQREAILWQ